MIDTERSTSTVQHVDKFDYFTGPDGETYRIPKAEFAAELSSMRLKRMSERAVQTAAFLSNESSTLVR
ncbi:MAG: hypothetical protein V4611_00205 [Patescibacteria group bacterium]